METKQAQFWKGDFGKEYTDRNTMLFDEWERWHIEMYGESRIMINERFLSGLDRNSKILEVGCNTGGQLAGLKKMGFENLYGIDLQSYAVEKAKQFTSNINIIQGSGFDIPFKDNYFDLVFTNGVLIHINPSDLFQCTSEIVRCSNKYIWGFEYYSDSVKQISYRGNEDYLWKADYATIYVENFPELRLAKKEMFPYINQMEKGNSDCMFLLQKVS